MGRLHKFNRLDDFDKCTVGFDKCARSNFEVTFFHGHYDLHKDFPSWL